MSNVVQLRSDDFLSHVRDLGSIAKAREAVGMDQKTYNSLMVDDKFAITVMECLRECAEDNILKMQAVKLALAEKMYIVAQAEIAKDTARLVHEVRNVGRT